MAGLLMALGATPASAMWSCSGSGNSPEAPHNLDSGEANFTLNTAVSPKTLTLVLKNTTTPPTQTPGDTLTGVVFDIGNNNASLGWNNMAGPTLGPGSQSWISGSQTDSTTNPAMPLFINGTGSSWTNALTSSAYGYGVATTGVGLFKGNGMQIGNAGPDYAIVSAGTFPGSIGGSQWPWIQDSLQFVFTTTASFTEADIKNVSFVFGTKAGALATTTCKPVDFGDAPDTGAGTAAGNYKTTFADNGPRHLIVANLMLGAVAPDSDSGNLQNPTATADDINNTADEDAVGSLAFATGSSPSFPVKVTNTPAQPAYLRCWMDLNGNGSFLDAGEASSKITIPASSGTANYNVIFGTLAISTGTTYLRCRISQTSTEVDSSFGLATSGEVEDHAITILAQNVDFGDLPQGTYTVTPPDATNYQYGTTFSNNGPYHAILANGPLIGAAIDPEGDGQPTYGALGDDINPASPAPDDEDGVISGVYRNTEPSPKLTVYVTNPAGSAGPAYLSCWMDLNGNGQFNLPNERNTSLKLGGASVTSIPANTANQPYEVGFNAMNLQNGVTKTFLRCRVSTVQAQVQTPTGGANDGEVEDHQVSSTGSSAETDFDFGDAPDPGPGTGGPGVGTPFNYQTRSVANSENGPYHSTGVSEVWLGGLGVPSMPDPDSGLLNDTNANSGTNSDDVVNTGKVDDEDGLNPAIALVSGGGNSLRVTVTNATTIPTVVACWIDMNRDGVFATTGTGAANGASGEVAWATVNPTGPSGTVVKLNFAGSIVDTPSNRGPTYVRCRVTTDWIPTNGIYGNPLGTQAITSVGPTLPVLAPDSGNGEVEDYSLEVYPPCVFSPNPSVLKVVTAPALTWNLSPDATIPFKGIRFTVATGAGYPSPTSGGFTKAECSLMDNFNPANAKAGTTFISGINDPALTTGTQVSPTSGPTGTPPATVSWTLPATSPLTVEMHKSSTAGAAANCAFFDAGGNACTIDPWYISAIVLKKGKATDLEVVETQAYNDVPVIDDFVEVTNGKPGVKKLDLIVNGTIFRLSGLKDNEVRTLCISSALIPGISNTVTVEARGKKGGSAEIIGVPSAGRCKK